MSQVASQNNNGSNERKYYNCSSFGHIAKHCPSKRSNNSNRNNNNNTNNNNSNRWFKGKCRKCGKKGHKDKDCWEKEENANKRPAKWRGQERGNIHINTIELQLSTFQCDNNEGSSDNHNESSDNELETEMP